MTNATTRALAMYNAMTDADAALHGDFKPDWSNCLKPHAPDESCHLCEVKPLTYGINARNLAARVWHSQEGR